MNDKDHPIPHATGTNISSRSWSREDKRLLVITFAGTAIANILTILVVGLAVVATRYIRTGEGIGVLIGIFAGILIGGLIAGAMNRFSRWFPKLQDPNNPRGKQLALRVYGMMLLAIVIIGLMILIGLAVGIK